MDPEEPREAAVNAAVRCLCGAAEVAYEQGLLVLHFLHGGVDV